MENSKITAMIRSELVKRQGLEAFSIKILTKGKIIILSGQVDYLHHKLLAESIAKEVSTSRYSIKNSIQVK